MTRAQAKALSPVRDAWIEGKAIQYRFTDILTAGWHDYLTPDHEPTWEGTSGPLEWRVKPEPREVWVRDQGVMSYRNKEAVTAIVEDAPNLAGTFRLYREVEGVRL